THSSKIGLDTEALYKFVDKHLNEGLRTAAGTALFECASKHCESHDPAAHPGPRVEQLCTLIDNFEGENSQNDMAGIADELKLKQYTGKPIRAWLQESGRHLRTAAIHTVNHPASHLQAAR